MVHLCGWVTECGHRQPGTTRRRAGTCASDALHDAVTAPVVALTVVVAELKAQMEVVIRSTKMWKQHGHAHAQSENLASHALLEAWRNDCVGAHG